MKVGLFAPTAPDCGIADYARGLVAALSGRIDVKIVAAEDATSLDGYRAAARRLCAADVAHVQYEHAFFLADDAPARNFAAFRSEITVPCVVTLHSLPLADPEWLESLRHIETHLVVHSRRHAEALAEHDVLPARPRMFLPAPRRETVAHTAEEFRQAHDLGDRPVVTMFGFTKPHKGHRTALEALAHLHPDTVLLIAGGPQDDRDRAHLAELRRAGNRLGLTDRLRVTGYLPSSSVGAALRASDVVLAPFEFMTASASIATALAWERPVVASDLAQTRELQDAFGCLETFPCGDSRALARAIVAIVEGPDLREELLRGARAYRAECSYERLGASMESLYTEVVRGRSHAAAVGA